MASGVSSNVVRCKLECRPEVSVCDHRVGVVILPEGAVDVQDAVQGNVCVEGSEHHLVAEGNCFHRGWKADKFSDRWKAQETVELTEHPVPGGGARATEDESALGLESGALSEENVGSGVGLKGRGNSANQAHLSDSSIQRTWKFIQNQADLRVTSLEQPINDVSQEQDSRLSGVVSTEATPRLSRSSKDFASKGGATTPPLIGGHKVNLQRVLPTVRGLLREQLLPVVGMAATVRRTESDFVASNKVIP
ncbi:Hypothetical predicted protein, partial [Paramuricea clavata]